MMVILDPNKREWTTQQWHKMPGALTITKKNRITITSCKYTRLETKRKERINQKADATTNHVRPRLYSYIYNI